MHASCKKITTNHSVTITDDTASQPQVIDNLHQKTTASCKLLSQVVCGDINYKTGQRQLPIIDGIEKRLQIVGNRHVLSNYLQVAKAVASCLWRYQNVVKVASATNVNQIFVF